MTAVLEHEPLTAPLTAEVPPPPSSPPGMARLEGKQLIAAAPPADATVVVFEGAVRSSKTIVSLILWLQFIRRCGPGNLLMVGKTETALINNLLLPLQQMLGPHRVVINRGLGEATIMGRTVLLMGANNEQARTKVQGLTLLGAYVDEVANVPESFFNMLRSRLSAAGARMFLTCNPEGPKHWFLTKWLARARWWVHDDGEREEQTAAEVTIGDEQLAVLPWFRVTFTLEWNYWLQRTNPSFVAELKASYSGVFYQRMILSRWVSADGMVYEGWDEARMTITSEQLPAIERVLISALDYGTNHRTRAYLLGIGRVVIDNRTGLPLWGGTLPARSGSGVTVKHALYVLDEFAPPTATVGEHARLYRDWISSKATWGSPAWHAIDPAAAVFKAELFAAGMANVLNAHNAVLSGIQTTASLLATSALFIVRDRCPQLTKNLPAYMWDTKAAERGETRPLKENDDEADALRYAVYTSRRDWRAHIPLAPITTPDYEEAA